MIPWCFGRFGVRSGKEQAEGGHVTQARPDFLTVHHPGLAVDDGARAQPGEVRPGAGLGEQLAPDLLVAGDRAQEALPFALRCPIHERGPDEVDADRVGEGRHLVAAESAERSPPPWTRRLRGRRTRLPTRDHVAAIRDGSPHLIGIDRPTGGRAASGSPWSIAASQPAGRLSSEDARRQRRPRRGPPRARRWSLPPGLSLLGEGHRALVAVGVLAVREQELPTVLHRLGHRPFEGTADRPLRGLDRGRRSGGGELSELDRPVPAAARARRPRRRARSEALRRH